MLKARAEDSDDRLVAAEAVFSAVHRHLLRTVHSEQQAALLLLSSSEETVMMEKLSSKGLLLSLLVRDGKCPAEGDGISIFNGFFTSTDALVAVSFLSHGTLKAAGEPERIENRVG